MRRRFKNWAKWACTLAAGAAIGLAVFSGLYKFQHFGFCRKDTALWAVFVNHGLLYGFVVADVSPADVGGDKRKVIRSSGWSWGYSGDEGPGGDWHAGVRYVSRPTGLWIGLSLLHPVLLTSLAAAALWYADRRGFGPGFCKKCGYDRRGLVGGVDAKCPECGTTPTVPTT